MAKQLTTAQYAAKHGVTVDGPKPNATAADLPEVATPSIHVRLHGPDGLQRYQRLAIDAIKQGKKLTKYAEEILNAHAEKLPKV